MPTEDCAVNIIDTKKTAVQINKQTSAKDWLNGTTGSKGRETESPIASLMPWIGATSSEAADVVMDSWLPLSPPAGAYGLDRHSTGLKIHVAMP
jgi:hypothetical protein